MTINSPSVHLAAERRLALVRDADQHHRARAARPPARAGRLTIRIRPVQLDDAPLLADIFDGLSPASRFARFLSPKAALSDAELRYFTEIDHRDHEALIALTRLRGQPVGVARFIRDVADPTSADVAVAVVDDWQDRGVGTMLAARLVARALREDITGFTALTAADNRRAQRLLGRAGDIDVVARDGGTVSYRVGLTAPAMPDSRAASPLRQPGSVGCIRSAG